MPAAHWNPDHPVQAANHQGIDSSRADRTRGRRCQHIDSIITVRAPQGRRAAQLNRLMRMPPTATMPAMTTKTFEALPRNRARAGTLWMAYIGMR